MRISEWSSDVCSSDLETKPEDLYGAVVRRGFTAGEPIVSRRVILPGDRGFLAAVLRPGFRAIAIRVNATSGVSGLVFPGDHIDLILTHRSEEHTSELQSLMRISYAVFCLKKKKHTNK